MLTLDPNEKDGDSSPQLPEPTSVPEPTFPDDDSGDYVNKGGNEDLDLIKK